MSHSLCLIVLQVVELGTNLDPGFPAEAAFKYHVRVQPLHLFQVRGPAAAAAAAATAAEGGAASVSC